MCLYYKSFSQGCDKCIVITPRRSRVLLQHLSLPGENDLLFVPPGRPPEEMLAPFRVLVILVFFYVIRGRIQLIRCLGGDKWTSKVHE